MSGFFGGGGGAVLSVSNVDGTITSTPTIGAVVVSLNVANANTWSALQTFGNNISIGGAIFDINALAINDIIQYNGINFVNVTPASIAVVGSVSNSDGTLTISPTTGSVVASINHAHGNTWTAQQVFNTGGTSVAITTGGLKVAGATANGSSIFCNYNTSVPQMLVINGNDYTTGINGDDVIISSSNAVNAPYLEVYYNFAGSLINFINETAATDQITFRNNNTDAMIIGDGRINPLNVYCYGQVIISTSTSPILIVCSNTSLTSATGFIAGNPSTTSGTGGLYLSASAATTIGNNCGLLFVGPNSGQWEQGPSSGAALMSIALNSSTSACTYMGFNTPTGVPIQTTTYGGAVRNILDDGNGNMTSKGWIWQQGMNYVQPNIMNPTGTASTTYKMMGMGGSVHLTPKSSGHFFIQVVSDAVNTVDGNGMDIQLQYSTGVAPSNGAASAGAVLTTNERDFWGSNTIVGFATNRDITGLSVGTSYWFDLALKSLGSGSSNATVKNVSFRVEEV